MHVEPEAWDIAACPKRPNDPHDPIPENKPVGEWLTPDTVEFFVRCRLCGARGVMPVQLRLGTIQPRE